MEPIISFIITGRNDNYGGDFKLRLQQCISTLFDQLLRYKIKSEIIFVNYNPLIEPKIVDFIKWPQSNEYTSVKIISIPFEVHEKFLSEHFVRNDNILEFPAKNIGIRRARGEYVLCMNADILIDDLFFNKIKKLKKVFYYRTNRRDFRMTNQYLDPDKIIAYAKEHITKIYVKGIAKDLEIGDITRVKFFTILYEQKLEIARYNLKRMFNFWWSVKLHPKAEYKFHCNASGDFMLMHRDNWFKLRAYKENSKLALHVDALMVIQAFAMGLKEHVFSFPIYHQEHHRRYGVENENSDFKNAYIEFQNDAQNMIQKKSPIIYNNQNWGFANLKFEETIL